MVKTEDFVLIILSIILIKYANLIFWNTGEYLVFDFGGMNITFEYKVDPVSTTSTSVLYFLAMIIMLYVGKIKNRHTIVIVLLSITIIAVTGYVFHEKIFSEPDIKLRVQGGKTDAYVLQYESAKILISGKNPYDVDFSDKILSEVPGYFRTFILGEDNKIKGLVTKIDYPAFSFIWYVPSALLGIDGVWQDLLILIVLVFILLYVAPDNVRALIPLAFIINWDYLFYTIGYITDIAWVFLITLTLLSNNIKLSAISLGLAISYKAEAWIFALYYLVFIYKYYGLKELRTVMIFATAVTLIVNLPFIILNPKSFFSNVVIPITENLPSSGVGLYPLLTSYGINIDKDLNTIITLIAFATTILTYYVKFDYIKINGVAVLPMFVLWFHSRSLQNYLMWWPIILIAALLHSRLSLKYFHSLKSFIFHKIKIL